MGTKNPIQNVKMKNGTLHFQYFKNVRDFNHFFVHFTLRIALFGKTWLKIANLSNFLIMIGNIFVVFPFLEHNRYFSFNNLWYTDHFKRRVFPLRWFITWHDSLLSSKKVNQLVHDGYPYNTETTPLICSANLWAGFFMIGTFVMKESIPQWI